MHLRRAAIRPRLGSLLPAAPTRDLRPRLDATPAEARRLVRTVGTTLFVAALVLAFAASAQTAAYGPGAEPGGGMAWIFALFAGAAMLAVFLLVLSLIRGPAHRPGARPPGAR